MKSAYPNKHLEEDAQENLKTRMMHLCEMKQEYRRKQKAFKDENKHLLESIKSLENIVMDEVMSLKRTVVYGDIKAEYKPQVVIRLKKEQNND